MRSYKLRYQNMSGFHHRRNGECRKPFSSKQQQSSGEKKSLRGRRHESSMWLCCAPSPAQYILHLCGCRSPHMTDSKIQPWIKSWSDLFPHLSFKREAAKTGHLLLLRVQQITGHKDRERERERGRERWPY